MSKSTKDDYVQSVCRVILYIEQNYNSDLTLDELSKIASFSKYHFHRIFKSIVGESMVDYIRRVRLQSTTLQFKTNQKITQIAMNSGYETNASFSKAFKKHFGITPKEFAKNAKLKRGNKMLEPKIVKLEDIEILYVRKTGEYTKCSIEAWETLINFVGTEYFIRDDVMMFGIGHDNPRITDADKLRYDACVSWVNKNIKSEGEIQRKIIDGGKYAMFLHKGSYTELINTYDGVSDWIVESGVELRDLPIVEKYLNKNPITCKPEDLRTEIYIPLV
ncbi:transcriptional regulator, AraC family [Arcobacter nitrofigilis DSM 7299]|uniref:Transcriptional regulator, AraC family n=1 Tax=Arcobacter nitrofigilis (strain ATCC 33309 / DSM 7299 / CCUG 15893 / LMG 7604 / NCTC 12251 / CI) TaxID=572480 RepID=D5V6U5_ARCNC|nr:AraC family transcriptional regulator [Arcobacter nitrofigilis]ADG94365.1 transcriptional regulator, AraC family [Arcobacter nitrofigilis DSM 7299]